jgi:ferredoxin-type protein NapH
MKRQNLRRLFLLISFLIFPITQYYFSPILIISGVSEGIINGSFIVFSFLFFISIFFGRIFCGWIAPCGSLQEFCFGVNNKKTSGGKLNLIKFFI